MIILRQEKYENARIGCCGLARYDVITPVGYSAYLSEFEEEAIKMVSAYGTDDEDYGDTYSLEYFEGAEGLEDRANGGKSLYKMVKEEGRWAFYINGKLEDTFTGLEELKSKWGY